MAFLLNVIDQTKEETGTQTLARYTRGAAVIALGMIRDGESIAKIQELTGHADPGAPTAGAPGLRDRAYAPAGAGLGCHVGGAWGPPSVGTSEG